jgi:hypothetical protein
MQNSVKPGTNRINMKNFLKYSTVAAAVVALAGSVQALPTLVVTDGNAAFNQIAVGAGGSASITTSDGNWAIVISSGTSQPPLPGGNPSSPIMDVSIQAIYLGSGPGTGNPLTISWANDSFGPTSGTFVGVMTGHGFSGPVNPITWTIYDAAGTHLPSIASPLPPGVMTTSAVINPSALPATLVAGPVSLANPYTLGEEVILTGSVANGVGSSYSFDASITTVPDGGMTLVLLGSALSGLALLKRKLV